MRAIKDNLKLFIKFRCNRRNTSSVRVGVFVPALILTSEYPSRNLDLTSGENS